MTLIEKQHINHYHSERLKDKSLPRFSMMGWSSKEAQQIRFKAITSLFEFNNTSVLDLGCGDGDFKDYLDNRFSNVDYIGLDLQESFINYAKERFKAQDNTWFYHTDFTRCQLPKVDVVVASGALSYRSQDSNFYINCIKQFYDSAQKALIFNMLNEDHFEPGLVIVSHNKTKIFALCEQLSDDVTLYDSYLKNDFTIIMKKPVLS